MIAFARPELGRFTVTYSNGSRFIQEQGIDIAGRFNCFSRFGDNISA